MRNAEPRLKFIKPQEPLLVLEPPVSDDWLHEIKYDGFRTQLIRDWAEVRAFTRTGIDWSKRYWPVVDAAEKLPAILWDLVEPADGIIQYSQYVEGDGAAFLAAVDKMGLEGMVSKRRGSPYRSGESDAWVKTKCWDVDDLDLIGVKREAGKQTEGLFAKDGKYVGKAVIATTRAIKDRLWHASSAIVPSNLVVVSPPRSPMTTSTG